MNSISRVPAYIFDIDGTLADGSHRIHHIQRADGAAKNWDSYFAALHNDTLIKPVANIAKALYYEGNKIVFVSGRPEEYRYSTIRWLDKHALCIGNLYMRPAGDRRDDDIVKIELLAQIRLDGYEPIMAFDDRDRVVRAWRAAGIPCAQVAEGDF